MTLTTEQEKKRLHDFKKIAENWELLPERAKGRIEGTVGTIMSVFIDDNPRIRREGEHNARSTNNADHS